MKFITSFQDCADTTHKDTSIHPSIVRGLEAFEVVGRLDLRQAARRLGSIVFGR
jgi:hypothetical protein